MCDVSQRMNACSVATSMTAALKTINQILSSKSLEQHAPTVVVVQV